MSDYLYPLKDTSLELSGILNPSSVRSLLSYLSREALLPQGQHTSSSLPTRQNKGKGWGCLSRGCG